MIKLLSAIFLFHFKINWTRVWCAMIFVFYCRVLIASLSSSFKIGYVLLSAFAAGFSSFASLGALTSLTSFVSEVGALTSLLDTETALATGLASGAFQLLLLDLQLLQFWLCFCICTTCFFSCFCFAI